MNPNITKEYPLERVKPRTIKELSEYQKILILFVFLGTFRISLFFIRSTSYKSVTKKTTFRFHLLSSFSIFIICTYLWRHLVVEKNRTILQDNFVWPIEVFLIGRFCLPKSRCIVKTVRKCQLVYYAYNYKKVDERGFKLTLLQVLV
ncbi:hypothetical protein MTR67_045510 [Solanum verrucosum]|uniref:Uncharacterized protein n=1 Tax=Solanum verrucosum TaxID=315347 RepID=A0AAF0UU72_SOLVR|nr:hypothetical protein MTR67_045510 [Solanum verrucosum]